MKKLLIGIDDTDNLESPGTGAIADGLKKLIAQNGWGSCSYVTRHQLYLHPDIAYTSHNSSMIFAAEVEDDCLEQLQQELGDYLLNESAEGSDPGLCIAEVDKILDRRALIEFGYRAKCQVMTKEQAYALAAALNIYLVEKGGSGIGVIGALAGVGLRLDGNDGEVKGGLKYAQDQVVTVAELLQQKPVSAVLTAYSLMPVPKTDRVQNIWKFKPVLHQGEAVLLVVPTEKDGLWKTMAKQEMRQFGEDRASIAPCENFCPDVSEEQVYAEDKCCFNCAYRRWTAEAFTCEYKGKKGEEPNV